MRRGQRKVTFSATSEPAPVSSAPRRQGRWAAVFCLGLFLGVRWWVLAVIDESLPGITIRGAHAYPGAAVCIDGRRVGRLPLWSNVFTKNLGPAQTGRFTITVVSRGQVVFTQVVDHLNEYLVLTLE